VIARFFGLLFLSMFMCHCGTDSTPTGPAAQKAPESARNATLMAEQQAAEQKRRAQEAEAKREQEALALGLRWRYDEWPEKMGRGTVKTAMVRSLNEVQFDFPYQGSQRGVLQLRIHPKYGKDVILTIEKGQFLCGIFNCQVAVRFDTGKAQNFTAVGPADHSTTTIFIRGYERFLANARKAKKVYIEAMFYHEGTRVFEFDISGLKW
jgi:hypothetical protein